MLVFFLHGVNTKNCDYAKALITHIEKEFNQDDYYEHPLFYSSFWGNLFNNKKNQINSCIKDDIFKADKKHPEYQWLKKDFYRYLQRRLDFVNNFLGDFLIYQNPARGEAIRQVVLEQLMQYIKDHPKQENIHFIAHSLGSVILWDILFSQNLPEHDAAFRFRDFLQNIDVASITTLGSPLLFIKHLLDLNFSHIHTFTSYANTTNQFRWVNIIHSSDLIAYPLQSAIKDEIGNNIFFCDQYVWQDANTMEKTLNLSGNSDLAMVIAAEDAHSSYLYDNLDGRITGRIIAYNLKGQIKELEKRCISPK
ncbi:hypothetical protein [Calothrix sp. UHCC 0171]|uniref:alpha/beta hydrolase n=1 Tax=Calothrix sp. UHCC 0171 TaxID=3110245 RepID=UPI002B1EA2A5|nr:hypothetical protein [Calothrix sp. UHCC 0171]MEA5573403.1 hypothetical protein [Calothrix sp. UHCC 0171]